MIALVNNMPDAALRTTEQQFQELLGAAGADTMFGCRLFSFPELIRAEAGAAIRRGTLRVDRLRCGSSEFDALIVTGAEPRTPSLADEAYWPSLTRLVDWALESGTPLSGHVSRHMPQFYTSMASSDGHSAEDLRIVPCRKGREMR